MVTIKQALTNTHGASIKRTIADVEFGEAFKWVKPRDGSDVWCVRVGSYRGDIFMHSKCYHWMPLEGPRVGTIWIDANVEEIHQP